MRHYLRVFEIAPGGWLLLSLICFFADFDEFLVVLMCVFVHEMGHLFALELFGIRVRRIVLDYTGMTICFPQAQLFGVRESIAAFAGPMFGLLVAGSSSVLGNALQIERLMLFAGGNFVLSVFNLLPAKPLDGWRCIHAISPVLAQVISVCTAITVLIIGIWVMYGGYGTALAIMGILLLLQEQPHRHRSLRIRAY